LCGTDLVTARSFFSQEGRERRKSVLAAQKVLLHQPLIPPENLAASRPAKAASAEVQQKLHFPGLKDGSLGAALDELLNQVVKLRQIGCLD
jgi:hypothetical protein